MPSFFDFLGDLPNQVGTTLATPKPQEVKTPAKPGSPKSLYEQLAPVKQEGVSFAAQALKEAKESIAPLTQVAGPGGSPGQSIASQRIDALLEDINKHGVGPDKPQSEEQYANDLLELVKSPEINQKAGKRLLEAVYKLREAHEATKQIEGMKAPGGPLAVTPEEVSGRKEQLSREVAQKEAEAKSAGMLTRTERESELQKLKAEQARVESVTSPNKQSDPPLPDAANAVGVNRGDLSKAYMAFAAPLIAGGFNLGAPIGPSMLGPTIIGITKAMGPEAQAAVLSKLTWKQSLNQYQREKPMGTGKGSEPDPFEARMAQREAEMDAKFQELNNLQVFSNTGDVLLYIVFSLLLGPQPATLLFTNHAKRGTLRDELDLMHQDLDSMYKRASAQQRLQEMARQNAAEEDLNERKFAFDKTYKYDKLYADIAKGRGSGKSPTDIALDKSLRGKMNEYNRLKDQLNNEFAFDLDKAGAKAVRDRIVVVGREIDDILALIYNSANPDIKQAIDEYNADQGE